MIGSAGDSMDWSPPVGSAATEPVGAGTGAGFATKLLSAWPPGRLTAFGFIKNVGASAINIISATAQITRRSIAGKSRSQGTGS